ncbi:MAG TPA: pyridoxamine 5'-phosphate oxidase family protein [Flavobacterium sp.]|nr:pyridoxamine 5'-phosphate oxidase family protein [Flavobacterium sp.]
MSDLKNLSNEKAVAKLKELAEDIGVCLFCTELTKLPITTRPMGLREVDDHGNLWFLSSRSSNKNFEIKHDNRVQLFFSKTSDNHFLSVYGTATVFRDQSKIEEIWTPIAEAWFEEGKKDPEVTVIKVQTEDAYYWDTKDGKVVSLLKIAFAAATGIRTGGGIEGNIHV